MAVFLIGYEIAPSGDHEKAARAVDELLATATCICPCMHALRSHSGVEALAETFRKVLRDDDRFFIVELSPGTEMSGDDVTLAAWDAIYERGSHRAFPALSPSTPRKD